MKLDRLRVDRLPGLPEAFELRPQGGVNILLGPNASGKSSVARAVRGLLWPEREGREGHLLTADFNDDTGVVTAQRSGGATVEWHRAGISTGAPEVPGNHLADCYRLGAPDLLAGRTGELDQRLAVEMRTQMTGGIDLEGLAGDVGKPGKGKAGQLARALDGATAQVLAVGRAQDDLAGRFSGLGELEQRLAAAERADQEVRAYVAVQELRASRAARDAAAAVRKALPAAVAEARTEDTSTFESLQDRIAAKEARGRELATRLETLTREADTVDPGEAGDLDDALARLESRVLACRETAREAAGAAADLAAATKAWQEARGALTDSAALPDDDTLPGSEDFDELVRRHRRALEQSSRRDALERLATEAPVGPMPPRFAPVALLAAGIVLTLAPVLADTLPPSVTYPLLAGGLLMILLGFGLAGRAARGDIARRLDRLRAEARSAPPTATGPWTLGRSLDDGGWLRDLDLLRQAATRRADWRAAQEAAATIQAAADRELDACAVLLAPWGREQPSTAAAADAELAALRRRRERHVRLREQRTALHTEQAGTDADLHDLRTERAALLARLDLPENTVETAPIRDLVDRIPQRDHADEVLQTARQKVTLRAAATAGHENQDHRTDEDLAAALEVARERAASEPTLREERATLRRDVETARAGHDRAAALATETARREDLSRWRDEARGQTLEAALLTELRDQYEALETPAQLDRARHLFATFTDRRYHLTVAPAEDGAAFRARDDHTGHLLGLDQLSDGTRAQLLLAVRLAFLEHAEDQVRPPLFLDESLTTADCTRLDAVAGALGRMAADTGRQIFYLTSQPGDVGAWRAALAARGLPTPTVLDLAAARNKGTTATADELTADPVAPVPDPTGFEPAAYGAALGVRRFDPHEPWQATDTFHLAAPDLSLVRNLRTLGLATTGALARTLGRDSSLVGEDTARLELAVDVLKAFAAAWRVGRPRPLEVADIDGSDAVSDAMRDAVLELLASCDSHGGRFMAALRNGGVKRFRADKTDALAAHLENLALLDGRPPLNADDLLITVQRQMAGRQKTARAPEEVRALVLHLLGAIPRAVAADPSSRPAGSGPTG